MAPDVKDLLHAPKPGSLNAAPKAAGISTGWSSDALLMALLPHLPQDGLPLAIQAQIGTFKQSNTGLEGKQLHALVAQKSQAEKEINKIQLQRDKYERGWAQYVAQMSELFMQQLTHHEEVMQQFDQAEPQWTMRLESTTRELREKASGQGTRAKEEEDEDDVEAMGDDRNPGAEAVAATAAKAKARREDQTSKNRELHEALQKAKLAAEASTKRTGSRSPRRDQQPIIVDSPEAEQTPVGFWSLHEPACEPQGTMRAGSQLDIHAS